VVFFVDGDREHVKADDIVIDGTCEKIKAVARRLGCMA